MPAGVTVVELNRDDSFTVRMTKQKQEALIDAAIKAYEDKMMDVYRNTPGVDNVKWNTETWGLTYIVVNDDFFAKENQNTSTRAIIELAMVGPMVQVYKGLGMDAECVIMWGDAAIEKYSAMYSPLNLADWIEW